MVNFAGFNAIDVVVFACGGFICTDDNICGPDPDDIFSGVRDDVLNWRISLVGCARTVYCIGVLFCCFTDGFGFRVKTFDAFAAADCLI